MELSDAEKAKYKFRQIEVEEERLDEVTDKADIHRNLQESQPSYQEQRSRVRKSGKSSSKVRKEEEKRYGWAFFLASLFTGLGITTITDVPVALFVGLAVGFLFFVDPIYDKVMEIIQRL